MPYYILALLMTAVGLLAASGAQAADSMLDAEVMYSFSHTLSNTLNRNWWDIF